MRFLAFAITWLSLGLVVRAQEVPVATKIANGDYSVYDNDLLGAEFHAERRSALRKLLPENSVAVLFANPIRNRSNDVSYEYHQDPNFYYLTGLNEPHSMLLLFKEEREVGGMKTNEILVVQNRDPHRETWDGKRLGLQVQKMCCNLRMS